MDTNFLKAQIERCRHLAENADEFTKRRLLALAEKYEGRLGKPSAATRTLKAPIDLSTAPNRLQNADPPRPFRAAHAPAGAERD